MRRRPNDGSDLPVMNVADIWKQVMFDLEIQTSNVPGKPFAVVPKIGRGQQLMYGPVIFKRSAFIRQRKLRALDNMSRLKYNGKDKSSDVMHRDQSDEDLPPKQGCQNQGYDESIADVDYLR
jgi:hypothetical protein